MLVSTHHGVPISRAQQAVFSQFFHEHLPQLHQTYAWPTKKPKTPLRVPSSGYELSGNGMAECIKLKHHLTQEWERADAAQRNALGHWIVANWGGVLTNDAATIDGYVSGIQAGSFQTPLQGVASYSKILSVVDCRQYAIYDARVVASLNALQLLAGATDRLFFTYIPGRNKAIHGNKKQQGFVQTFPKKALFAPDGHGWMAVPRDESYATYLSLLHGLKADFPGHDIYHFEMTLFSLAPDLCRKAMQAHQRGATGMSASTGEATGASA